MTKNDALDPKGLIYEAFRIDGITTEQCRSIFLDWALSLPEGINSKDAIEQLVSRYQADHPAHPMTDVLKAGLANTDRPKRRGGWRGRAR